MPRLIEFPIVGEIGLRHHAQDRSAANDHRAIEQLTAVAQRRANDEDWKKIARGFSDFNDAGFDAMKKCVLKQQIVDGVSGNPEFGKNQ